MHLEIPQKYITPYHTGPPQTPRYHTNPDPPIDPAYDHFELGPGGTQNVFFISRICILYFVCSKTFLKVKH